jgi:hypothetical protein
MVMAAFGTAVACFFVVFGGALDLFHKFMAWTLFLKEKMGVQRMMQQGGITGLTVHAVAEGGAVAKGTAQGLIADEARDKMTEKVVGEKYMTGGTTDDSPMEKEGKEKEGGFDVAHPLPVSKPRSLPPLGNNRVLPL